MRTLCIAIIFSLCLISGCADGLDVGRLAGNDSMLKAEYGYRPDVGERRTEIGLYGVWMDGLQDAQTEGLGAGAFGTYDLVQQATMQIIDWEVAVEWYVGTALGGIKPKYSAWDATGSLMTGLNFGDQQIRLGARYEYNIDQALWQNVVDLSDKHNLLATIAYRF